MIKIGMPEFRSILLQIYLKRMQREDAQEKVNSMLPRALRDSAVDEIRIVLRNKLEERGKKDAKHLVDALGIEALFSAYLKLPLSTPVTYYPDAGEQKQRFNSAPVLSQSVANYKSISEADGL
jgi:hypothetical protein